MTSSPTGPLDNSWHVEGIDQSNQFRSNLKRFWKQPSNVLMISADPDNFSGNDEMTDFFHQKFDESDLTVNSCVCMDHRWEEYDSSYICSFDVIVLCGGHVPTQNRYFREMNLRMILQNYKGLIIGISAGSMNAADVVYCQPEEYGEATDPYFNRFIEGLDLTKTNLLPHHNMARTMLKENNLRLFEDITFPDSYMHPFLSLKDGSYLLMEKGKETVYGESYLICNGEMTLYCSDEHTKLYKGGF